MTRIFLSHSSVNKPVVRTVMAELVLMGADPFYDEMSILNGASIPKRLERALDTTEKFVLFWSKDSANSNWVNDERAAAETRFKGDDSRFLVVLLDDFKLPSTLAHKKYINAQTDHSEVAREILGLNDQVALTRAVQETLDSWGIEVRYLPGLGPYVGCGGCGRDFDFLETSSREVRDSLYVRIECRHCHWYAEEEVPGGFGL